MPSCCPEALKLMLLPSRAPILAWTQASPSSTPAPFCWHYRVEEEMSCVSHELLPASFLLRGHCAFPNSTCPSCSHLTLEHHHLLASPLFNSHKTLSYHHFLRGQQGPGPGDSFVFRSGWASVHQPCSAGGGVLIWARQPGLSPGSVTSLLYDLLKLPVCPSFSIYKVGGDSNVCLTGLL